MSGRDQQDPIHKEDRPAEEPSGQFSHNGVPENPDTQSGDALSANSATADSLPASPSEDLVDEPAFYLPAVPIEPTRAINAPASHALASGDDLLDYVSNPLGHGPSKPAQRFSIPDDLDPELFAKPLPSDPTRPATRPLSAVTRADRLTEALRPEASDAVEAPTSDEPFALEENVPDFPITPFAPFVALAPEESDSAESTQPGAPSFPLSSAERVGIEEPQPAIAPPDFRLEPEPETRIPNFGHLAILAILASIGFVAAGIAIQIAFRVHLWGVKTIEQATNDVRYTLTSMAVLYLVSFAAAFFVFPLLWDKPFFKGLQWNAGAVRRYLGWLFAAACFCFILALVDDLILPSPTNAPIDKMFSNSAAAWLLFGFGVAVAPFFEEITFRGFILPAFCTTFDWIAEYFETETQWSRPALVFGSAIASSALAGFGEQKFGHHRLAEWVLLSCFIAIVSGLSISWLYQRYQALGAGSRIRPLGPNGHPQWSLPAMIVGSALTSLPFAWMHAEQTGYSLGPFVLLFCVSLILCFARLATRSLAASTFVHASYNFILFSLMLWGTDGFKHLDKM